jgi:penicillin-insensitive murein endopeptidase
MVFCFSIVLFFVVDSSAEIPARAVGTLGIGGLRDAFNAHAYLSVKPHVQLVSPEAYQYSTQELAEMIGKLGDWMYTQFGRRMLVGDISHKLGGKIGRHRAHRNGLDVDIGYFGKIEVKEGHRSNRHHNRFPETFVNKKKLSENFDVKINFEAFKYLVENFDIRFILVTCEVKRAIKFAAAYTEQERGKILSKLWAKNEHVDHFHVRLACPPGHIRCDDKMPERVFSDRKCSL